MRDRVLGRVKFENDRKPQFCSHSAKKVARIDETSFTTIFTENLTTPFTDIMKRLPQGLRLIYNQSIPK